MASRYEVEVNISSARGLKNVNWRHGPNKPYVVVWVDPIIKFSTFVDENGNTEAEWDQPLVIPLPPKPLEDQTLYIDVVHAGSEKDTKKLIGSARIKLVEFLGERVNRTLTLKRPSGRPQGKIDVTVSVREPTYRAQGAYYPPPEPKSRNYSPAPPVYGYPAKQDSRNSKFQQTASFGKGYSSQTASYGQGSSNYGYAEQEEKKGKFGGMGTGFAIGAAAGLLGGIVLAEGAEHLQNKIVDDVAERVEHDLGYNGDNVGNDSDEVGSNDADVGYDGDEVGNDDDVGNGNGNDDDDHSYDGDEVGYDDDVGNGNDDDDHSYDGDEVGNDDDDHSYDGE